MDDQTTHQIVARLCSRYGDAFTEEEVTRVVVDSTTQLAPTSKAPQFLPILVERFARERLIHQAQERGTAPSEVQDILFVCNGNAGRSQMAAAFANAHGQGRVRAWSAGINPLPEVLPDVVAVMREKGVDLSDAYAKPVTTDATEAADFLVSIGVPREDLPAHGRRHIEWDVAPVVGQDQETTRRTRDDLERRVRGLLGDILG